MKICVESAEAAERLDELIDLALRDDEVVIYSSGHPVAVVEAMPGRGQGTIGSVLTPAAEGRPTITGQTANHENVQGGNGAPE
jgi:hypothetical protein